MPTGSKVVRSKTELAKIAMDCKRQYDESAKSYMTGYSRLEIANRELAEKVRTIMKIADSISERPIVKFGKGLGAMAAFAVAIGTFHFGAAKTAFMEVAKVMAPEDSLHDKVCKKQPALSDLAGLVYDYRIDANQTFKGKLVLKSQGGFTGAGRVEHYDSHAGLMAS